MKKEIKRTELGKKIKRLRDDRDLTIEQVAEALGIKLNTYGTYERNINPKRETLVKIAEFFDVSLDYLMGKEDKTPKKDFSFEEAENHNDGLTLSNYDGYQVAEGDFGKLTEEEIVFLQTLRSLSEEDKIELARYLKNKRDNK